MNKKELRQKIASIKKDYTPSDLQSKSEEVFSVLEIIGIFRDAKTIFIYNSLPDEVETQAFIEKWKAEKTFYLPVVTDNGLVFRVYNDNQSEYTKTGLGISEPIGKDFTDYKKVDLIIVPGVAFDRKMNRLGRGKGFYDKFLPLLTTTTKVGVCFDFQLFDNIPTDNFDVKMDMIISENDIIWQ